MLILTGFRAHFDTLGIFCLKEYEKRQVQEGLSNLPLKQIIKPHVRDALPIFRGKKSTSSSKNRSTLRGNLNEEALLSLRQFTAWSPHTFVLSHFP